jgi:DNA-directed RNA polymerase specialized sigma24 family protein
LVEDSLMPRVRHFDSTLGKRLIDFARRGVRLDPMRAAFTRAHEPLVMAGLRAMDRHEEAIEHPDLGERFAETLEQKDTRARGLGAGLMGAAHHAHTATRAARNPEEELREHEEWREMRRAAESTAPRAGELPDLLYAQEMTWEDAADRLGIDVRQAQRIEQRVIARRRALIVGRRRRE